MEKNAQINHVSTVIAKDVLSASNRSKKLKLSVVNVHKMVILKIFKKNNIRINTRINSKINSKINTRINTRIKMMDFNNM